MPREKPVGRETMEPLVTPEQVKSSQYREWILRWQGEWLASRPNQVAYLRRKGCLLKALRKQCAQASSLMRNLWDQGLEYREAADQAASKYLEMPTPGEQRRLPPELAPFGQPGIWKHSRGGDLRIPDATPEQVAKALLTGGAAPRPETRRPK